MRHFPLPNAIMLLLLVPLSACQTPRVERDDTLFLPRHGGDAEVIAQTPLAELQQLQLISTYGKRLAETQAGIVNDYSIAVGDIEVRREYDLTENSVFPSSLLLIRGTSNISDIKLDDNIFIEQGGSGGTFISGVGGDSANAPSTDISTVTVNAYDVKPVAQRSSTKKLLSDARRRVFESASIENNVDLDAYTQMRRTVVFFNDQNSVVMGRGNKQAIGQLADEYQVGDIYSVVACTDVDGQNNAAQSRGIRVEEEFVSHGISAAAVQIEPCVRVSYRHSSDDSPEAVSVLQYRKY